MTEAQTAPLSTPESAAVGEPELNIFGYKVDNVACFKESYSRAIRISLILGLGHFMLSSRIRRTADVAAYSFVGISIVNMFYCRYMTAVRRFRKKQFDSVIDQRRGIVTSPSDDTNATPVDK